MKFKESFNNIVNHPLAKRVIILLVIAGFIGLGINAGYRATRNTDFNDYYDAAKAFREGKWIYEVRGYKYPQFFAIIFSPFTVLSPFPSAVIWYVLNVFFLAWAVILGIKAVSNESAEKKNILYIIPPLITSFFWIDNLMLGQVNILMLLLICGTFYLFKTRKDFVAGILLAFSISVKITPALFFLYFLYKKQFKLITGALVGLIIFLLIFPSLFLGIERNLAEFNGWSKKMLEPFVSQGEVKLRFNNQSLPAALNRFLTDVNAGKTKKPIYVNVLSLDKKIVNRIVLTSYVLILLILVIVCRSSLSDRTNPLLPLEYSAVLMATLFISATSWTFHFTLLLFSYTAGINYLLKAEKTTLTYRIMYWSVVTSCFFYLLIISDFMRALSCILAGSLVLWAGTVAVVFLHQYNFLRNRR